MEIVDAIHTRRTIKSYRPEPVPRHVLERILDAARWAPCHRMTEPWRFRVVGPQALERLSTVAGDGAKKLRRAPTLVVASFAPSTLPPHAIEDEQAAACAVYAVLLAAHAEGVASYWRTPGVLRDRAGRDAVGVPGDERILGLLHFGTAAGTPPKSPRRRGIDHYVAFLD